MGPYEIAAAIGSGGMGEVYRARDARLDRNVALKIVRGDSSPEQVERLEREARAVGSLNHPNIVAVYDVGTADGHAYVVSELLEGQTLRDRITGPLPVRKAVDYAGQIARGLAAAHEKGVLHRDIKPDNLFLTRDDTLKILDFGLAKRYVARADDQATTSRDEENLTETGVVLGTAAYMSPEQARGQPVDHRTDIFSFGSVLYEMLTGSRAFQGESRLEVMHAIVHDEPRDLLEIDPRLDPSVVRLVHRCMEKQPGSRFQSARDLAFRLDEIQGQADSRVGPPAPRVFGRRGWGVAGLTAAALAVGAALGAWWRPQAAPVPIYQQVTFRRGTLLGARFGPDGKTVVYSGAWEGGLPEIRLTLAGSTESRPWGEPGASILAASTSGELALLLRRRSLGGDRAQGVLARASFAGGAARQVLEDVQEADWSPDGTALAVLRSVGPAFLSRLEYPVGSVLLTDTDKALHDLRVSPTGDAVALFVDSASIGYGGAVTVIDRTGKRRQLTRNWRNARGLAWSPSGREIWFTAAEDQGQRALRAVSLAGKERLISTMAGSLTLRDLSASGRALLAQDSERRGVIALAPGSPAERDYTWLDRSAIGDLSADGRTLLFGDHFRVYTRSTDGAPAVNIGEGHADALSADGKWALATNVTGDGLVVLPVGPGEPRSVARHFITSYAGAAWLPDGEHIVFNGRDATHDVRVYTQALDGTPPRAITPEGTRMGALSPDGRRVAVVARDGSLWAYPIDDGEARRIADGAPGERVAAWNTEGTAVWVYPRDEMPVRVDRVDVASGRRELWKAFLPADPAGMVAITKVDLTPDGRYYAYSYRRILSELYVVDGLR
jgi:eukaryotic-like serine/threonine-protein kinase